MNPPSSNELANKELRVEFGDPEHGWIDLTIQSGAEVLTLSASYLLYDTVDEMVDALHALITDDGGQFVRVFEEPEIYELRFDSENGSIRMQVCGGLSYDGRRGIDGHMLLE